MVSENFGSLPNLQVTGYTTWVVSDGIRTRDIQDHNCHHLRKRPAGCGNAARRAVFFLSRRVSSRAAVDHCVAIVADSVRAGGAAPGCPRLTTRSRCATTTSTSSRTATTGRASPRPDTRSTTSTSWPGRPRPCPGRLRRPGPRLGAQLLGRPAHRPQSSFDRSHGTATLRLGAMTCHSCGSTL